MALRSKKQSQDIVQTLRDRGLSCGKLKAMTSRKLNDARTFRTVGFINLANREEAGAREIRRLREKVCRLK